MLSELGALKPALPQLKSTRAAHRIPLNPPDAGHQAFILLCSTILQDQCLKAAAREQVGITQDALSSAGRISVLMCSLELCSDSAEQAY